MPILPFEFDVFCSCGKRLNTQTTFDMNDNGDPYLIVTFCRRCSRKVEKDSYDRGYNEGQKVGSRR